MHSPQPLHLSFSNVTLATSVSISQQHGMYIIVPTPLAAGKNVGLRFLSMYRSAELLLCVQPIT